MAMNNSIYFPSAVYFPADDSASSFDSIHPHQLLAVGAFLAVWALFFPFYDGTDIQLYHAAFSAQIRVAQRNTTLATHLKNNMPSLTQNGISFRPHRWFRGCHMQTIYDSVQLLLPRPILSYQRKWLKMPDQGLISLDFYPSFAERPMSQDECFIVIIPGLTGGSEHEYITAFTRSICLEQDASRVRCVVCNYRGCSQTPVVTRKLYHGGGTQDLRCAILYLLTTFPGHRLFGIGFSLGANVLVKYAGEEGKQCPLTGIVSLGNIWDYVQVSKHLESGPLLNRFFYKYMLGRAIRELIKGHAHVFGLFDTATGKPSRSRVLRENMSALFRNRFVTFECCLKYFMCPLYGFASPLDYCARTSSIRYIDRVAIPCLALNSRDDPLVPSHCLPYCQALASPWFVLATTRYGGHIGWVEENGSRWYIKPAFEFIQALLQCDVRPRPAPAIKEYKGLICTRDSKAVAFREVVLTSDVVQ